MHEDEFTIIEDIVGPGDPAEHHHLVDYETQDSSRNCGPRTWRRVRKDLGSVADRTSDGCVGLHARRRGIPGQPLQRGIRAIGHLRRLLHVCGCPLARRRRAHGQLG